MLIDLRSIPVGGMVLKGEESPEIIDIQEPGIDFSFPVLYEVKVTLAGNMLLVSGWLKTGVRLECSRCLTEFNAIIDVKDFFLRKEIVDPGMTIDLTEDIRADIILALPVKPLCKTDCAGICPLCGQDLNIKKCGCSSDNPDSPFAGLNIKT